MLGIGLVVRVRVGSWRPNNNLLGRATARIKPAADGSGGGGGGGSLTLYALLGGGATVLTGLWPRRAAWRRRRGRRRWRARQGQGGTARGARSRRQQLLARVQVRARVRFRVIGLELGLGSVEAAGAPLRRRYAAEAAASGRPPFGQRSWRCAAPGRPIPRRAGPASAEARRAARVAGGAWRCRRQFRLTCAGRCLA